MTANDKVIASTYETTTIDKLVSDITADAQQMLKCISDGGTVQPYEVVFRGLCNQDRIAAVILADVLTYASQNSELLSYVIDKQQCLIDDSVITAESISVAIQQLRDSLCDALMYT